MSDPYAVLGVARDASDEDIKRAYRKLAKMLHPDLNPGDESAADRFKAASAAYDLLGDAEKRRRFDAGEIDASGQETPQRPGADGFFRDFAGGQSGARYRSARGFDDLGGGAGSVFEELLRRQQEAASAPRRGEDRRFTLSVPFREAALGGTRRVALPGGDLDLSIPAGAETGTVLRLREKGDPGFNGGPPGDALVTLEILADPAFERTGLDVTADARIPFDTAMLGGRAAVETLHGTVMATVPAGSQSGTRLRLSGQGVRTKSAKGDHFARLLITVPAAPDAALQEAVRAWRERSDSPSGAKEAAE